MPSSSSHKWKYDVFVSFRGCDVRKTFLSHLCRELRRAGLRCFMDNNINDIGQQVRVKIFRAIRNSRFAIVLFSENFAASKWCLDELVQILMCRRKLKKQGHVVIPVFFGVDATELSKLTSRTKFWQGFKSLCRKARDKGKIPKWKLALAKAKSISGFDLQKHGNGDQASFIERIVGRLLEYIPRTSSPDAIGVGLVPSSSASVHRWKYDVFVSFRGGDIRKNVAAHFFRALKQAGIYYFGDNEKEKTGILIEGKLPDAIRDSRVSLVVFTANYADSRRCLNELVEILEFNRRDHQGHVVLPIFYDVEPCDVRKQSGQFGDGFERCLATHTDDLLVQKWRHSLEEAGNLSGWDLNNDANGDQASFIEQIVGHLLKIIHRTSSPDAGDLPVFLKRFGSFLSSRKNQWREILEKLVRDPHLDSIGLPLDPFFSLRQSVGPFGGHGADSYRWEHAVFVSFSGFDGRNTFISHLFERLKRKKILYFYDKDQRYAGMNIEDKIFGAIHRARIAIAVFSANFAHSKWCMNELVEILNCRRDHHLVFIPIFYIRLAEVKTLRESKFEQALEKFDGKERDNKQRDWKAAIAEATEIHGFELENDAHGNEAALIDLIVERIEVRPLDSLENAIPRPHQVKVCRPSGGEGEKSWDFAGIKRIDVHHADYIESITFEDDEATSSEPHMAGEFFQG